MMRNSLIRFSHTCLRRVSYVSTRKNFSFLIGSGLVLAAFPLSLTYAASPISTKNDPCIVLTKEADKMWGNANLGDKTVTRQMIYDLLNEKKLDFINNADFLWRLARAAHDVSNSLPKGDSQKKARMEEALDIIKIALSLDENNSDAQRWCGTIISNYGDFLSTKEQIANSYIIKSHWEKAIELNPSDGTAMALIGRWCFTFANMGWVTRQVAGAIFGTPPSSSYKEALDWYLKAEDVRPGQWKMARVWIAECYIKLGDKENAKKWLKQALELGQTGTDDNDAEVLAKELSKQC